MTEPASSLAAQFVAYANDLSPRDNWEDTISGWGIDTGHAEPTSVLAEIVDTTRWSVVHRQVFAFEDGSHADVHWQAPSTEYQDQDPECVWTEVRAQTVTSVQYVPIEKPVTA